MEHPKYCPRCEKNTSGTRPSAPTAVPLVDVPPAGAPSPDVTLVSVFQTTELGLLPLAEMALDQEEIEYFVRDAKGPLSAGGRTFRGDVPEMGVEILVRHHRCRTRARVAGRSGAEGAPEITPPKHAAAPAPAPAPGNARRYLRQRIGRRHRTGVREQLQWLDEHLERESSSDEDYYIDKLTLEMLQDAKGDPALLSMLSAALGSREGMEIRWVREREDL